MVKDNSPETLANFINCLSILENNTFLLYKDIAEKVEAPLVKSFLMQIAIDSQKHSVILKGVTESIAKPKSKTRDCEKKIGQSWQIVNDVFKGIKDTKKIPSGDFPKLIEKLTVLESIMGEEYYMFVQMKTLEILRKEINQIYRIDLGSVKKLFLKIIQDEETHRELLGKTIALIRPEDEMDSAPVVKYQNPDSWYRPMPPTT